MLRFIAAVAMFLIAFPLKTQTTSNRFQTAGITNGRTWTTLSAESKTFYISGSVDSTILACGTDEWRRLFASSLSIGDVIKSLDKFYEEPTNAAVQVPYAMTVVKMKAEGASTDSIEKATATGRRLAAEATK